MANVAQVVRRALSELARELPGVPTMLIACDVPEAERLVRPAAPFAWIGLSEPPELDESHRHGIPATR